MQFLHLITAFIKRHPQLVFWSIAYSTFFIGNYLGGIWFLLIYGTFLGGAFVTYIANGRSGLKTYFGRIVRWRVGLKWYVIALSLPFIFNFSAYLLNLTLGAAQPTNLHMPAFADIIVVFLWPAFFGIALAEEPGFRGFALPGFLREHTALKAALIVGILHAGWHFPLLIKGDLITNISTILIIISASYFFTWLFNNTKGSVLLAMIFHSSEDLWTGEGQPLTFGQLFANFSQTDLIRQEALQATVFVTAAVLLVYFTKFKLGQKENKLA